jgi:hypothetical protein
MRAKAFPGEDPLTLPAAEDVAPFIVKLTLPEVATTGETHSYREQQDKKLVFLDEHRNRGGGEEQ